MYAFLDLYFHASFKRFFQYDDFYFGICISFLCIRRNLTKHNYICFVDIRMAVLKTKISTTKIDNKIFLKTQINYLLKSLRNPTDSWTKDDLVETVRQMLNKLYERNALDLLEDLLTAISEDENINNTLRICQKEILEILDSLENKYHADINVSEGCVCFTFHFHTDNDLESFLVKVQEGQVELWKDISDFLLNKTLMKVFRVDSIFANLVISKVTANKGLLFFFLN